MTDVELRAKSLGLAIEIMKLRVGDSNVLVEIEKEIFRKSEGILEYIKTGKDFTS